MFPAVIDTRLQSTARGKLHDSQNIQTPSKPQVYKTSCSTIFIELFT